jgi:hypothetical protein
MRSCRVSGKLMSKTEASATEETGRAFYDTPNLMLVNKQTE